MNSRRARILVVSKACFMLRGQCGWPQSYTTDCKFSQSLKLDWKSESAPYDNKQCIQLFDSFKQKARSSGVEEADVESSD